MTSKIFETRIPQFASYIGELSSRPGWPILYNKLKRITILQ